MRTGTVIVVGNVPRALQVVLMVTDTHSPEYSAGEGGVGRMSVSDEFYVVIRGSAPGVTFDILS